MLTWSGLIFLLCSLLSPGLCCDWLRHYGHLSNNSLTLIRTMGGELTEQESPVPFPKKLYRSIHNAQVESQLVFIRDSLKLISRIWLHLYHHDNLSSVTWDTIKTEHFLMTILRQLEGVNTCVLTNRRADSRLIKYYKTLRRSLNRSSGSTASLELIRKETKLHLDQLDMLVSSIRGQCTTCHK